MPGTIRFSYDTANDVVIAVPHWHIRTEQDCEEWYEQYRAYLAGHFSRKVDVVFVLDDFKVDSQAAGVWGQYRARVCAEFMRHTFRVHPDWHVKTLTLTSGIRYDAATNEAATVEDAIAGILAARAKAAPR